MSDFAYLQSASQSGNTALAFPSSNIAGNLIVVATSNFSVSAISDTQGNSYGLVAATSDGSSGGPQVQIWIALNINAGANSVTATGLNGGGNGSSIAIIEYTAPSSFASTGTANPGAGMVNGSNGYYQSSSEALLIIATHDFSSAHSWTGTNLTVRETTAEGGGQTLGIGDFYSATSTTSAVSTLNGGGGSTRTASLLNFIVGGGGSSTSHIQISLSDPLVVTE
jgi:hypothetical protein